MVNQSTSTGKVAGKTSTTAKPRKTTTKPGKQKAAPAVAPVSAKVTTQEADRPSIATMLSKTFWDEVAEEVPQDNADTLNRLIQLMDMGKDHDQLKVWAELEEYRLQRLQKALDGRPNPADPELERVGRMMEMIASGEPRENVEVWAALENERIKWAKEHLTTEQRAEMLNDLPADETAIFAELVERLEQGVSPYHAKAWYHGELAQLEARRAISKTEDPLEIESVHTLARTVFAKMLTNEIGIHLFPRGLSDLEKNHDVVGGLYGDIAEAIVAGLAGCDMDELHRAACIGSVR